MFLLLLDSSSNVRNRRQGRYHEYVVGQRALTALLLLLLGQKKIGRLDGVAGADLEEKNTTLKIHLRI